MTQRTRWLALALLLALPARADEAGDRLRQAANLAQEGLTREAAAALPDVSILGREHVTLMLSVAQSLAIDQPPAAAHLLAAARRIEPDAVRPRTALESLWGANPTLDNLYEEDLPSFPVDAETASFGGITAVTLSPRPFLRTSLYPSEEWPVLVGAYAARSGRLGLRFVVHASSAVDPGLARHAGRYLVALSDLTDGLLGRANRAAYPVPVWLTSGGRPGARQWNGSITISGAGSTRSGLEWARELAHEWGHACLPGIGGFTQPEAWANGDLGERLFLPMMDRAGRLDAWGKGIDIAPYEATGVQPLLASFRKTGPLPARLKDTGLPGYRHFLGACLYVHEAYGAQTLMTALDTANGGRPSDFMQALRATLAARPVIEVRRAGPPGPRPICIPRAGRYTVNGLGVRAGGRPLRGTIRLPGGWTMMDWSGTLVLRPGAQNDNTTKHR